MSSNDTSPTNEAKEQPEEGGTHQFTFREVEPSEIGKMTLDASESAAGEWLMDQICEAGPLGLLGCDQCDWGEAKGGNIWEFWRCDPCCGDPVNTQDALACCVHFLVLGPITSMNWFARETKRPCAIFPHCLCYTCCGPCFGVMHRYNVRTNHGIKGNIVGDCCCSVFCGPCAKCQVLRSVPPTRWKYIHPNPEIANEQLRLLN